MTKTIKDKLDRFLDYYPNPDCMSIKTDTDITKYIRLVKRSSPMEFIYMYINKDGDVFQIEDKNTSKLGAKLTRATFVNNQFIKIPKKKIYKLIEFVLSKQSTLVIQGLIFYDNVDMTFWIKGSEE